MSTPLPKHVAVLCVGFIKNDFQSLFAIQTALSIAQQQTIHNVAPILVINEVRQQPDDRLILSDYFPTVIENDVNNLSRAWNKGMAEAFSKGADYCLILNMDVALPHSFVDNIVAFAQTHPECIAWSGPAWDSQETINTAAKDGVLPGHLHFSCFMIDKRFLDIVGPFDEQFGPAYHEDADMSYRLKLLNLPYATTAMAPFYHLDRVSLKGAMLEKDEEFLDSLRIRMDESMAKYVKKWGGLPGHETFPTPYNK